MQYQKRLFFLCASLFLFTNVLISQATIRGKVYDAKTGEPISFADVFIANTNQGTTTDLDGFYNITGIGQGTIVITASYLGYQSMEVTKEIGGGGIYNQNFLLESSGIQLEEVNISAKRESARSEVQVSKLTVTNKQITQLPSLGGEPDIAQYLQVLPGVVSTGDQGGQLFIRGGSPFQNKILLDGLNIYNPFHSLGLFSSFETDIIKNVDVYTAGFDAEYGSRTSAVIDIKTREGNKQRFGGFASVSPFSGKLLLETPLKKFDDEGSSISMVLTGKKSLINQFDQNLYKYAGANDTIGLPFDFTDLYGKISVVSSGGSKFNFFGFNFNDQYTNPLIASIGWANSGIGGDFLLIPEGSSLIIDGIVGYSNYVTSITEGDGNPRESGIRDIGGNINFRYYGNNSEVKYGFDFRAIRTDFEFTNPFKIILAQNQNTAELGGFVKYKYKTERLVVEPSFRMMYYASQRKFSPEPRIGLKANITDDFRFKAAGGLYSQNIISTSNDNDIVNLFNGFLTGPEEPVNDFEGNELNNKLVKAAHAVAGFEMDLGRCATVNIESYYKDFSQILVINRNKLSAQESDYALEKGWAYGGDVSLQLNYPRFDVWTTYSLSWTNRDDGRQIYPTVFDRRHNVNFVFNYYPDQKKNTNIGLRWNLGTGFPFTQTLGFYNYQVLGSATSDYVTSNPDIIGTIFSPTRNGGRLPSYHRLDLSISHKITFTEKLGLELTASVVNVYNRENIFYFDRLRYNRVNQLPVMPSVAAKFTF
ncbi:MAG: carboxypeptidase-like regulatory domain-containing protein [Saprospiraceae bacterium]|nr:carboxypeptidase-like regulatory domain-containing protein [Saprospiraceae bacterium]